MKGKGDYTWRCNFETLMRAVAQGCSFCTFIDYNLLQFWYEQPNGQGLIWGDHVPMEVREALQHAQEHTRCVACAVDMPMSLSKTDDGGRNLYCFRCLPRVAQYLARHREQNLKDGNTLSLRLNITFEIWSAKENLRSHESDQVCIKFTSPHAHHGSEQSLRIECTAGKDTSLSTRVLA